MIKKISNLIKVNPLYKILVRFIDNNGIENSGYLAYLNILSLFPILFILISTLTFFEDSISESTTIQSLTQLLPTYLLEVLKPQAEDLINGPPTNMLNIAFIGAIWTASSSVDSLSQIFNRIYKSRPKSNILVRRIISILYFLLALFIIVLAIFGLVLLPDIIDKLQHMIPHLHLNLGSKASRLLLLSLILAILIFFFQFVLTSKKLNLHDILPGSLFTLIAWIVSAKVLTFYIDYFSQTSLTYGSLTSIIICLMFFYLVNMALLLGAEINQYIIENSNFSPKAKKNIR